METDRKRVIEARPPAPYIGGKRGLGRQIADLIDRVPHRVYAEPFVGMGGVFLRRRYAPKTEVINDVNGDVSNLFRILQRHYPAMMDMLKFQLTSRRDFDRLRATEAALLTDLERAARFLYLQNLAFGGRVKGRTFGITPDRPGRFDVTKLGPQLAELSERLASVTIENLPYYDFVPRFDYVETLFYFDPPYFGCETDYGTGVFERRDFGRLAEMLRTIKGRFILSINDTEEMREIFAAFDQETVEVTYTLSEADPKLARELIVTTPGLRQSVEMQGQLFA